MKFEKLYTMIVSVVGLGFVGLTLSLAMADKGVKIYGVEAKKESYDLLKQGISTFNEKGIDQYLKRNLNKNFQVFYKLEDLPDSPDIFVICVATPLLNGKPSMTQIKSATESVGKYMKGDELVIIRSTIPVGTTRNFVIPILKDQLKERGLSENVNIVYAPERTAEGVALKELAELPQIVGGINDNCNIKAMDLFRNLTPTVIQVSSIETAEMIKLIDNSFRDVRFAFANEISLMCERVSVDAHECISKSNIHYPRNNIPLPSPGVGGPCLSKDPYLLANNSEILKNLPHQTSLILTGRHLNESIPKFLAEKIEKRIPINNGSEKNTKIFILGFAFKGDPETSDIRESPTLEVVNHLEKKFQVFGHDHIVPNDVIEKTGVKSVGLESGFQNANCVIIMNNHKKYRNLDILDLLKTSAKPCLFVDCWRLYDKKIFENYSDIIYTGVGIV